MKKDGFTLVETLVVISIIAVLLAILLPVFSSVRQRGRGVLCQSNIRQIGVLFDMYHTTHGVFPSAFARKLPLPDSMNDIADQSVDLMGLWWLNYLDIAPAWFSSQKQIARCPSNNYVEFKYKYNVLWGNYGANWSVCKSPAEDIVGLFPEFIGAPVKRTSIRRPSETLLLADSGYALLAWANTLPSSHARAPKSPYEAFNIAYIPGASVNEQKLLWPVQEADALGGRHPGKTVNCLFTDGTVQKKKADDLVVQPLDHGQFENLTPLWKPR